MQVTERVGPYRVLEEIGVGGMGEVFLALDPQGRTMAVKLLHPAVARDEVSRRRLEREVATMRRVRGPYVAEVLDADFAARRPYIVTRYAQGRSLEEVVREQGPLRGAALHRVARGLARALATIHDAGVVHRDLKPANVILVDGAPVVIDFGLAHVLDATRLTRTGTAIGTPGYLAPEILDGERAGPAADVFSWAATVVFAATGRSPYGSGPPGAIFSRVLRGRHDLAGLPAPLHTPVAAALAPDPTRRPTPAELLDALTKSRGTPPESKAPPPPPSPRRELRDARSSQTTRGLPGGWMVVPALACVLPVLVAGGAAAWFGVAYARRAGERARGRMAGASGGVMPRLGRWLAAAFAVPLEITVRAGLLAAALGTAYLVVFLFLFLGPRVAGAEWPGEGLAASLPLGVLGLWMVSLRAWYGVHGWVRFVTPVGAMVLLVGVAVAVPPVWWPFQQG